MSKRVITFGQWDGKPIQWLVLKEDEFKTFVVSKYPLFAHCFNEDSSDGNRWKTSSLRNYLNSTFWETAFSAEEKKKVVNCMLEHPDHTKDNVFVLSKEEAENLLTQNERTFGNGKCHGFSRNSWGGSYFRSGSCSTCFTEGYKNGYGICCWLRSPYSGGRMCNVSSGGNINDNSVDCNFSIRPALYLKK